MCGQPILTAIGANYVSRQGKIRDRAVARCAGKVEQSIRPLKFMRRVSGLIKHICMPDDLHAWHQGIVFLKPPLLTKAKPGIGF